MTYSSRKFGAYSGGKLIVAEARSQEITFHLHTGGRERKQEVGQGYTLSKSISSDTPPLAKLHILKIS